MRALWIKQLFQMIWDRLFGISIPIGLAWGNPNYSITFAQLLIGSFIISIIAILIVVRRK